MRWPDWAGVGERRWKTTPGEQVQPAKTAWDVLQLLIVPLVLAGIALAFNAAETSRDRSRQDRQTREDRALALAARQDATLDDYLKQMSTLMLDRHLGGAKSTSPVADVARTITLATLRRLDGTRKAEVIQFLSEAKLIETPRPKAPLPVVSLKGADLRGADFRGANLSLIPRLEAQIFAARASTAPRSYETSSRPPIFEARLSGTHSLRERRSSPRTCRATTLTMPRSPAKASSAPRVPPSWVLVPTGSFEASCLSHASFVHAVLSGLDFPGVSGRGVDFSHATITGLHNTQRDFLVDVRLDGTKRAPSRWKAHLTGPAADRPCADLYVPGISSIPGIN